jgi:predicted nucleic-acid-binding Zn-ribbon protein
MKRGVCPKCGSVEVYRGPFGLDRLAGGLGESGQLVVGATMGPLLTSYLCAGCGYVERYVEDPSDLKTIMETCERVIAQRDG